LGVAPPGPARIQPSSPDTEKLRPWLPRSSRKSAGLRKERPGILVVDDEPAIRTLLQLVLEKQGFAVFLAANGLQALECDQRCRSTIAVVLLDVRMPGWDGPQTLTALQQLNPALCCCFMTGGAGGYTVEDLLERGPARVFPKPFRLGELAADLEQLAGAAACVS
jgi:CheY-like chemotaxis protein